MTANSYKMICDVILVLFYIVVQFDIESVLSYCQECVRSTTRGWPGLTSLSAPAPTVHSLCTGPTPCTCVRTPNSGTSYYYIISHNHPSFSNYLKIGNIQFLSTIAIFCSFNVLRSCLLRIKEGNHLTGPEVRFSFFHDKDNFNFIDWLDIYKILPKCIYFVNMIHRPTPQIMTKPEVLVTSDYQTNTTLKEPDLDSNSTESLRSPGGDGSSIIIVGVSIAGVLVVLMALVLVFFFRKRKRRNRCKRDSNQVNAHKQGNIGNSFIRLQLHFNLTYFMEIYRTIKLSAAFNCAQKTLDFYLISCWNLR